jgi:hypothetical protein
MKSLAASTWSGTWRGWGYHGTGMGQNSEQMSTRMCAFLSIVWNMKEVVVTLLVLLALTCSWLGNAQEFLDQAEIARIQRVIESNQHYPALPNYGDQSARKALVFGLIMSFGGNIDSSGAVPGVRVALDRINNDSSLLPGYTLHYALSDSRVSPCNSNNDIICAWQCVLLWFLLIT